ncbi:hypothetical protein D3C85_575860 [compost metagenome]
MQRLFCVCQQYFGRNGLRPAQGCPSAGEAGCCTLHPRTSSGPWTPTSRNWRIAACDWATACRPPCCTTRRPLAWPWRSASRLAASTSRRSGRDWHISSNTACFSAAAAFPKSAPSPTTCTAMAGATTPAPSACRPSTTWRCRRASCVRRCCAWSTCWPGRCWRTRACRPSARCWRPNTGRAAPMATASCWARLPGSCIRSIRWRVSMPARATPWTPAMRVFSPT